MTAPHQYHGVSERYLALGTMSSYSSKHSRCRTRVTTAQSERDPVDTVSVAVTTIHNLAPFDSMDRSSVRRGLLCRGVESRRKKPVVVRYWLLRRRQN